MEHKIGLLRKKKDFKCKRFIGQFEDKLIRSHIFIPMCSLTTTCLQQPTFKKNKYHLPPRTTNFGSLRKSLFQFWLQIEIMQVLECCECYKSKVIYKRWTQVITLNFVYLWISNKQVTKHESTQECAHNIERHTIVQVKGSSVSL